MTSIDLRNSQFEHVRASLSGRLQQVYFAWVRFGPMTTRALSLSSDIDLLNVRPRTTDLVALGLVELAGDVRGSEGIYRARTAEAWQTWRDIQFPGSAQQLLNV